MRVENIRMNKVNTPMVTKNKNTGSDFKENLFSAEDDYDREKLKNLMQDIDEKSRKLKDTLDIGSLMEYKEMVSIFMKEMLCAYDASKREYMDYRGRHKIYVIIEEVNKKLSKMTEDFMKKEKDTFDVLKKIDEIKGLLVDMYD